MDDVTRAFADAQAALPEGWTLDSLRCASTGLRPDERSEDWIAVAVSKDGRERRGHGSTPVEALRQLQAST